MKNTFRINDNLVVDDGFKDFLVSSPTRVAALLNTFQTVPGVNYISITDKIDTITFLPQSKCGNVESNGIDPYSEGIGRTYMKVGRLVLKLFPKKVIEQYIRPSDVEEFVNNYKSFFDVSNQRIEIVSGEDIRKNYLEFNYANPQIGNLWKSCMRQPERQLFLDIYVNNPSIKMLVLFIKQGGDELVRGRALLWDEVEDSDGNKVKIMDRIYTMYDSDIFIFKKWARENGYTPKFYQNAKTQNIFDINNECVSLNLKVSLPNHKMGTYPYLDTFPFYDMRSGVFYNTPSPEHEYYLVQSNGGLYPPDPEPDEDYDDQEYEYGFDDDGEHF